jgi:hypothetical protein
MPTHYPLLTSYRVIIGLTMAIYVRAGGDIYANRKRLLRISNEHSASHISTVDNPFQASKTTEISFVSESVDKHTAGGNLEMGLPDSRPSPITKSPYSVTVSGPDPMLRLDVENGLANSDNMEMSPTVHFPGRDTQRSNQPPTRRAVTQTDSANWAYAKVAALFFVALMVTWIPSSANRVYSYVHPNEISLGLELASAFVLPLQGFWNAIIYATTSLPACRTFYNEIRLKMTFRGKTIRRVSSAFPATKDSQHGPSSSRSGMFTEIDSITSVDSRPSKC